MQSEQVGFVENNPLPTGYWTRPIYGENKGWSAIADNWLMQGYDYVARTFAGFTAFAPFNSGPETPHIMWIDQYSSAASSAANLAMIPTTQD